MLICFFLIDFYLCTYITKITPFHTYVAVHQQLLTLVQQRLYTSKRCTSYGKLEEDSTHKSAKTHAGTGFVTDLHYWPSDPQINGFIWLIVPMIVEHFYVKFNLIILAALFLRYHADKQTDKRRRKLSRHDCWWRR